MKRATVLLIFIFFTHISDGQINKFGIPLMKNYSAKMISGSDFTHSIIKDKLGNVYFANEDVGIIRYNGNSFRTIPVRNDALIRALGIDENGTIYAGGKYEFGYLEPDSYGKMTYVSLSQRFDEPLNETSKNDSDMINASSEIPKVNVDEILSLVVKDSNVCFVSKQSLFNYNIYKDSLEYINLRNFNLMNVLKVFLVNRKIIIGDNTSGLWEYKNRKVESLPGGNYFDLMRCMIVLPYDENRALVGTYGHGIFLYNYQTGEVNSSFIDPSLNKLLIDYRIYSGINLPSGEFAVGTTVGGVFILDKNGKLINHWYKDNSGLMDNGIFTLYCDKSSDSELWISTSGYISKTYINLPFTELSSKSGIEGGVNCICEFDGKTYISTDAGVFKSGINEHGYLEYLKIPEIADAVFPLHPSKVGNEEFLLVGSINGLLKINQNGKVEKIAGKISDYNTKAKKLNINARIIVQSKINQERFYFGCNTEGVVVIDYQSGKWNRIRSFKNAQGTILGLIEAENGDLIFNSDYSNILYRIPFGDTIPVNYGPEKGIPDVSINTISRIGNEIVVSTAEGLFKFIKDSDSWVPFTERTGSFIEGKECTSIMLDQDNGLWLELKDLIRYSEILFTTTEGKISSYYGLLAILPTMKMMDIKNFDKRIWMAKSNSVFVIDKEKLFKQDTLFSPLLARIVAGGDSIIMDESFSVMGSSGKRLVVPEKSGDKIPELRFNLNSVSFFWSTPYYIDEESITYSYKLYGFDKDWSDWEQIYYKDYTNLSFGHYHFRVKAKTATDIVTREAVYEFIILKPWYLNPLMIVLYALAVLFLIYAFIKGYTKKLKNENIRLEGIVADRTAVVVKQKEELESSIQYASRIQMALLPSEKTISENIKKYFVLFKPRDIVSGDFYWMTKKGERLYIVAADCTGHGVPGAFMSLLGMSFLDEIIDKDDAPRADSILNELRIHVIESLKQVGGDDEAKDGMDVAMLVIDFDKHRIEFSGAYNPCYRVRKLTEEEARNFKENAFEMSEGLMSNGKYLLDTIYASKMPIGISSKMNEKFVYYDWSLEKGISYYMFSDGYVDQFGGPKGRKFMKKKFKRLIIDIQDYPMNKQKDILEKNLKDWMGKSPQIDDILVMGIRPE